MTVALEQGIDNILEDMIVNPELFHVFLKGTNLMAETNGMNILLGHYEGDVPASVIAKSKVKSWRLLTDDPKEYTFAINLVIQ